ncbi:LysM peptidoglycan-binding domain-containing protein [Salinibacterium sp. SYSU T00001]|uniref:LysM peptidoglycan-binding domain-containing protein n=1 Tax=Homoserinimonas sedimenticola TaxID=2986805 RepID=UPI0022364528|nr:LysM peptidoglycan-binding domain-containing protein [Salinibacterium sedimenticola]MCW4384266.1 LysM peptidoglycan-binding domain-containing protein [Salinibacterium sedimenticola]
MTATFDRRIRNRLQLGRPRNAKVSLSTVPLVIASSLAMSMNLSGPIVLDRDGGKDSGDERTPSHLRDSARSAFASVSHAPAHASPTPAGQFATASTYSGPATYTVQSGDSVSGIAGRFGLSTASVLAMNGLGWKSVIHPGQVLVLAKSAGPVAAAPLASAAGSSYTISRGDTISGIAATFRVSVQSILSANGLSMGSIIYPGQRIVIPSSPAAADTAVAVGVAPVTKYTIVAGDTITSIANTLGVSVQALLSANGLTTTSTIYAGASLVVPAVQPAGTVPATSSTVVPMTSEMEGHARTIVGVGRALGVSDYGLVIALATAAQESTLRNLDWGDLDSVGLFQQRPSAGWGTVSQLTTPDYAARLFFGGPSNPNAGITRGLLDIPGWQSMTVTQAAQAVQISAFPDAYAKWETSARAWLAQIG